MKEKDNFALVPRPPSAVEKTAPGAKRILSGMVADTLALTKRASRLRIIVVNDEEGPIQSIIIILQKWYNKDAEVLAFDDSEKAWQELLRTDPDLLITDDIMPALGGMEIVRRLTDTKAVYPVILTTAFERAELLMCVRDCASRGLNIKLLNAPWDLETFLKAVEDSLKIPRAITRPDAETPPVVADALASAKAADAELEGLCEKGENHYYGKGVPENYSEAARWFRMAAEHGHVRAQFLLGELYDNGIGIQEDVTEAIKWYRKAAEQGSAEAQTQLGHCYLEGHHVQKDVAEGVKWVRKAAESGYAHAQTDLGRYYQDGLGVTKNMAEAASWFRKAAEQGDSWGQVQLGCCYIDGQGVKQDYIESIKWFRLAADQGSADGQWNLARCYERGLGVEQDSYQAAAWLRKAANHPHMEAQVLLASYYELGQGVPRDYGEAGRLYERAAQNYTFFASIGNAYGQAGLGRACLYGRGVSKDVSEAYKWFKLTAGQGDAGAAKDLALLSSSMSPDEFEEGERRYREVKAGH